jgi:hypothetical protein
MPYGHPQQIWAPNRKEFYVALGDCICWNFSTITETIIIYAGVECAHGYSAVIEFE